MQGNVKLSLYRKAHNMKKITMPGLRLDLVNILYCFTLMRMMKNRMRLNELKYLKKVMFLPRVGSSKMQLIMAPLYMVMER